MKVNARRIVQDIGIQVIARGANLALGVVVTLILARHLGTEGFGQWATLLTIIQLAATFSDLGLEPAVVSRAAADEEREGEWIGALVILRGALAIPATLISIGACAVIADTTDMFLAGVLLSLTLIASVPSALRAITQLRVRNDITMIALTTNSVLWALGVVLVAAHDGGIFAYATMFVASTFISAVVQAILSLRQRRGPLSTGRDLWREIVVTGISIGGAVVLISATSRAPQIFVYEMKGSTEAGLYAVAARLLDQSHFVPVALMTTLLPLLANSLKKDLEQAKDMLQRSLDLLLVISLPIVVVTYVAGAQLVELVFGAEYLEAAEALPVLMGAFVLISINYPLDATVIAMQRQTQLVKISGVGMVTMFAVTPLLVHFHGFQGAAWSVVITQTVVTGLTYRVVAQPLGMRAGQGRLLSILASLAGLLAVMLGVEALTSSLAILLVVTAVAYPLLLIVFRAVSKDDLRVLRGGGPPVAEAHT